MRSAISFIASAQRICFGLKSLVAILRSLMEERIAANPTNFKEKFNGSVHLTLVPPHLHVEGHCHIFIRIDHVYAAMSAMLTFESPGRHTT